MTFEAVCHAKYQEFSWDFVINVIDCMQNVINYTEMAYINDIKD